MKKVLLATTAIAGVALALQPAQAQETKFSIDGAVEFDFRFSTASKFDKPKGDGTYETDVQSEPYSFTADTPEIHINASREVAPGITTGMQIEFATGNADFSESKPADVTGAPSLDEFSGYIEGNFGKVEMGYQDGAAEQLGVNGYAGGGSGGIDGDADKFESQTLKENVKTEVKAYQNSDDDLKLSYYTPDFAGFKAGLSYAYRGYKLVVDPDPRLASLNDKEMHQAIEVGAAYAGDFGSAGSVKTGLGFSVDFDPRYVKGRKPTINMGINVGAIYSVAGADIGLGLATEILADETKTTPIHIQVSTKYTLSNIPLDFGIGFGYGLGLGTVKNDTDPELAASAWIAGGAVGYNIYDGIRVSADVVYSATSEERKGTNNKINKIVTQDSGEIGILTRLALSF